MTEFLKALLQTEIKPFLHDLAPVGSMLLHAFIFFIFILVFGFLANWGQEVLRARLEMRRALSVKRLFCRMCALMLKQPAVPDAAQKILFRAAPLFALVFALFFFFFMPFGAGNLHQDFSLLYFLFVSSCGVYAFIAGGWSSASRYGFFGAVRLIAQSLACQPLLAVVVVTILMTAGGSDLPSIMSAQRHLWFIVPHFPMFVLYLLASGMMLAWAPFGAPKSERELAGGIYAEYSGALYALFLMAENILLLLCSVVGSVLFLGGTMPLFDEDFLSPSVWLVLKTAFLMFVLTLMRCALPSWRTDKVMNVSFKLCLPFALIWLTLTAGVLCFMQEGV
ncbi:MAG: NADH-quinone oxidoreductase subunit H [Alphaproteobacteria bacterium]|nr:NADH-quinone oxidoreductase subunit H [Alphaproteobacteria bacterium]